MAATRHIVSHKTGADHRSVRSDVKAVQQLLMAAGEVVEGGDDGGWGDKTTKALESFQKKHVVNGLKVRSFVEVDDYALLLMAWRANILIPMPGKSGMPGIVAMNKWFSDNNIKYNAGAEKGAGNRAIFGVHGRTDYAIQTIDVKYASGPVEMDCTTYVNLMLSIFISGNVHSAPYDASCGNFGGTSASHCARDRYNMPLVRRKTSDKGKETTVNYFADASQIEGAVNADPNGLYVLEVAIAGTGSVKHMALLNNLQVYECTTGQLGSACINRSLADFVGAKKGKIYYLFGPCPTRR